eukprot:TRINITY_DN122257_c0_g1_i1.p1 TRINITY_DN122257_c0_g1~~TRINITY_DN122257_c0_g1_i1.p1  ORF type:complete len:310 (-),score=35.45 TRINITY_DN122257_c0_g1_i1:308-1237(-)
MPFVSVHTLDAGDLLGPVELEPARKVESVSRQAADALGVPFCYLVSPEAIPLKDSMRLAQTGLVDGDVLTAVAVAPPVLPSATLLHWFQAAHKVHTVELTERKLQVVVEWGNIVPGAPSLYADRAPPSVDPSAPFPAVQFYGDSQLTGYGFSLGKKGTGTVVTVVKQTCLHDDERHKSVWRLAERYYAQAPYSDFGEQDLSSVSWRPHVKGTCRVKYEDWHILMWLEDGVKTELWNNGQLVQTYIGGERPSWDAAADFIINPNYRGHSMQGEVAEIWLFDQALSRADREELNAYLTLMYIQPPIEENQA